MNEFAARFTGALFFGSSPNSGKGRPDFEKEVRLVAKAVGHALDHFDLVVDALDQVGTQRPTAMGKDAGKVAFESLGERFQWDYPTSHRPAIPAVPEALRITGMPVLP